VMAPARPERREAMAMGRTPWDTCREVRAKYDDGDDDDINFVVTVVASSVSPSPNVVAIVVFVVDSISKKKPK